MIKLQGFPQPMKPRICNRIERGEAPYTDDEAREFDVLCDATEAALRGDPAGTRPTIRDAWRALRK